MSPTRGKCENTFVQAGGGRHQAGGWGQRGQWVNRGVKGGRGTGEGQETNKSTRIQHAMACRTQHVAV
jgi:hypothetical protein